MNRRDFLKKTIKGVGIMSLTPFILPTKVQAMVKDSYIEDDQQISLAESIGVKDIITDENKFGFYRVEDKKGYLLDEILFLYFDKNNGKSLSFFADEIIAKICSMSVYIGVNEIKNILIIEKNSNDLELAINEFSKIFKKIN